METYLKNAKFSNYDKAYIKMTRPKWDPLYMELFAFTLLILFNCIKVYKFTTVQTVSLSLCLKDHFTADVKLGSSKSCFPLTVLDTVDLPLSPKGQFP